MNYYIVSEAELVNLRITAFTAGCYDVGDSDDVEEVDEAEAACRARPVPEWATEFAGHIPDGEYPNDACWSVHRRLKEITK